MMSPDPDEDVEPGGCAIAVMVVLFFVLLTLCFLALR